MSKNAGKYFPIQLKDGFGYISYDTYLQKPMLLELCEKQLKIKYDKINESKFLLSVSDTEAEKIFNNFIEIFHQLEDIAMCPLELELSFKTTDKDKAKEKYRYIPIRTRSGVCYILFEYYLQDATKFSLNNNVFKFYFSNVDKFLSIELHKDSDMVAKKSVLDFMEIYHYMKGITMLSEKYDTNLVVKKEKNMIIPLKINTGMAFFEKSMLSGLRNFVLEKGSVTWELVLLDEKKVQSRYVLSKDESEAKETYNNFVGWFHFINGIEIIPLFVSKKEETPKELSEDLPPEDLIDVLPHDNPKKVAYLVSKEGKRIFPYDTNIVNFALAGACEGGHMTLANTYIEWNACDLDYGLHYAFKGGYSELIKRMIDKGGKINKINKPFIKYYINQHLKSGKFVPEKLPQDVKNLVLECLKI